MLNISSKIVVCFSYHCYNRTTLYHKVRYWFQYWYILSCIRLCLIHTQVDVIRRKHFLHHQSLVNSPHKGQWHRALVFSLICACTNGWVNSRNASDFRCHRAHYDVTVMSWPHHKMCQESDWLQWREMKCIQQDQVFKFNTLSYISLYECACVCLCMKCSRFLYISVYIFA